MSNSGFIKIHRKIQGWEWYKNTNVFRVFMHLLIMANHEDAKWQGITVERGQRVTSYAHIATEIGDLSVQQVRTALDKLKSTGEITSKSNNKNTVITINNYNEYQRANKPVSKRITNEQQTNNKQITTNKKNKKNKEEKEYSRRGERDKIKEDAKLVLEWFNSACDTKFKATHGFEDNLAYWLTVYTQEDIQDAIRAIRAGMWWETNPNPTLLFRLKTPQGEKVDYIGDLVNKFKKGKK